jgi:hypothetical protein
LLAHTPSLGRRFPRYRAAAFTGWSSIKPVWDLTAVTPRDSRQIMGADQIAVIRGSMPAWMPSLQRITGCYAHVGRREQGDSQPTGIGVPRVLPGWNMPAAVTCRDSRQGQQPGDGRYRALRLAGN